MQSGILPETRSGTTRAPRAGGGRLVSLDVLRCLAVLLVIGRHMAPPPTSILPVRWFIGTWHQGGWIGVDLFFVLSGFLISGLLFRDLSKNGSLGVGRFLIRRGLKIYPAFYVLLAFTFVISLHDRTWPLPWRGIVGEVFYLQNYVGEIWPHTWSLAVEEHFYLFLPLVLVLLLRRRKPGDERPLRWLPLVGLLVILACIGLRLATAEWGGVPSYRRNIYPTHLRIDGLMFGVLLSYWHHYSPESFFRPLRWLGGLPFLVAGCALLAPSFVLDPKTSTFMHTFGLTLNYVGSGLILMYGLAWERARPRRAGLLAFVGLYSYSIYLWHFPTLFQLLPRFYKYLGLPVSSVLTFAVFAVASCAVGIGMAKLVEFPVLRLRDRLFPSRSTALAEAETAAAKA